MRGLEGMTTGQRSASLVVQIIPYEPNLISYPLFLFVFELHILILCYKLSPFLPLFF